MKKILLVFTLFLTPFVLVGCVETEKKNELLTEAVVPMTLTSKMVATDALFTLMGENKYELKDFSNVDFDDKKEELTFILKDKITYTNSLVRKPTTLVVKIEGPSNKDLENDIIELTYYSLSKDEDGHKPITKEEIKNIIERAKEKKETQYLELNKDFKETMLEKKINYTSTLEIIPSEESITIIFTEKVESNK
jgi:hypothetical protein